MNRHVTATAARAGIPVRAFESPGGIRAWVVEDHTLPLVSMRFAFRGGGAQDAADRAGLANFMAALLDEGAGPYDAQAYHERLDELAVELSFHCTADHVGGALRTLTRHLDPAAALLRLALTDPRFDADAIERVRGQLIATLRRQSTDPETIATEAFWENAYPTHPYGRPVRGKLDTAPLLARDEILARHRAGFARDNLLVALVGDIDEARLGAMLDSVFGALPATNALSLVPDAVMSRTGTTRVVTHDVPQSVVRAGRPGILRHDPDYIPAFLVNHVLGGYVMQSRLFTEVRDKRGLAYSAYSSNSTNRHAATFMAWTSTKNERVAESIDVIRGQVTDLADKGPTEEELASAKKYLVGSYPLRFDSSTKIAGELIGLMIEDIDLGYIARRNALIEAVTMDDARRGAKRLFGDGSLLVTVVGQPQGL